MLSRWPIDVRRRQGDRSHGLADRRRVRARRALCRVRSRRVDAAGAGVSRRSIGSAMPAQSPSNRSAPRSPGSRPAIGSDLRRRASAARLALRSFQAKRDDALSHNRLRSLLKVLRLGRLRSPSGIQTRGFGLCETPGSLRRQPVPCQLALQTSLWPRVVAVGNADRTPRKPAAPVLAQRRADRAGG